MENNNYTVYVNFSDGVQIREPHHNDGTIGECLSRFLSGPMRNLIKKLIVVDQLDCTNFHYENGSILFPVQAKL